MAAAAAGSATHRISAVLITPCASTGTAMRGCPPRDAAHYLVYRDTLAPKNTLANLTTALLETKAVQAFVVASSSSQTTADQVFGAWLLSVAPIHFSSHNTLCV